MQRQIAMPETAPEPAMRRRLGELNMNPCINNCTMDKICAEEQVTLIPGGGELFASPSCHLRCLAPRLDNKVLFLTG